MQQPLARAPPVITSTLSSSPATVQRSIPAPVAAPIAAPAPQVFPQSAPVFPSAPASVPQTYYPQPSANAFLPPPPAFSPQPFSFPGIFDPISNSDIPTIGKSFAGTSSSSTIPTLACSHTAITDPTFNSPNPVTLGTGESKITDLTSTIEGTAGLPFESRKEEPANFQPASCSRCESTSGTASRENS